MSHGWLARQRKQTLLELSADAGLPQNDDSRKDEIVEALDAYLKLNASSLAGNPKFQSYFGTRERTPHKARASVAPADAASGDEKPAPKPRARKPTKVKQEAEYVQIDLRRVQSQSADTSPSESALSPSSPMQAVQAASSAVASTIASASNTITSSSPVATASAFLKKATTTATAPSSASPLRRASELPGPPSPSVVADVVEQEVTRIYASADHLYSRSGISENIDYVRELCSSVTAVQTTFLLLEAFALQRHLMPFRYVFDLPGVTALSIPPTAVHVPDLFVLLTGYYWSTTLLWAFTSLFVPALFGYFYNLTLREVRRGSAHVNVTRYSTDPLTFNVVKALATWLVYAQGFTAKGLISPVVAERVDAAIYGGHTAVLIGSGIGVLAALYDAAQKK